MNTFVVTTTELKRDTSNVINRVTYEKIIAIIKRHGKTVAKITPADEPVRDINKIWQSFAGSIPDFPDVTKYRRSRKRFPRL